MNILILGASGPVGTYLMKEFKTNNHIVESTYCTNKISAEIQYRLDITDQESTKNLIKKINPELVIDTVALSGVDLAETNPNLADKVTVQGTKNVIDGCKLVKCKIAYVSTAGVFNSAKTYSEDDIPDPVNNYGYTKCKAEELVINSGLDNLILRTDHPYGWIENEHKRISSVIRALNTLKAGKILKEVIDWYSVPAYLPDFAKAARLLIETNEYGIFHVTGPDYVNRYEWSLKVAEIFGLDKNLIIPIRSEELKLPSKRGNANVSNRKLIQKTGFVMKGISEGLSDMYKKSLSKSVGMF